jgi:hypothetical protein
MEVGDRIETAGSFWNRCKFAWIDKGLLHWELDPRKKYELTEAYAKEPHRDLIAANSDELLQVFVRHWGPLANTRTARGSQPIESCRRVRDWLSAVAHMLEAQEKGEKQRECLCGFLRACTHKAPTIVAYAHQIFGVSGQSYDDRLDKAIQSASLKLINGACSTLIWLMEIPASPAFAVDQQRPNVVRAVLRFDGLTNALAWMVWQDMFQKKPFRFCEEKNCGKLVRSETRHARKFCSHKCAHRKTDRESKKAKWDKMSAEERREKKRGKKTR